MLDGTSEDKGSPRETAIARTGLALEEVIVARLVAINEIAL